MSYSSWSDERDYEHWAGFDVPTEDEEHDEEMRIEQEIDEREDNRND